MRMDRQTRQAVDTLTRCFETSEEVRASLRRMESAYRKAIKQIEQGADFKSTLFSAHATGVSGDVTLALIRLEGERHRCRVAGIAVALDHGMSIGAIARAWGVSRQLASRYAKEARELT
jgi:hypothetical protein